MQALRAAIAFLVAPLIGPLLLAASFYFPYTRESSPETPALAGVEVANSIFQQALIESYEATIFIGGPLYLLFRHLKWTKAIHCLVAGGVVALVPFFANVDSFGRVSWDVSALPARELAKATALFVLAGVATGLAFWIAAFAPLRFKHAGAD